MHHMDSLGFEHLDLIHCLYCHSVVFLTASLVLGLSMTFLGTSILHYFK